MRGDTSRFTSRTDSCPVRNGNTSAHTDSYADAHLDTRPNTDADPASAGDRGDARA